MDNNYSPEQLRAMGYDVDANGNVTIPDQPHAQDQPSRVNALQGCGTVFIFFLFASFGLLSRSFSGIAFWSILYLSIPNLIKLATKGRLDYRSIMLASWMGPAVIVTAILSTTATIIWYIVAGLHGHIGDASSWGHVFTIAWVALVVGLPTFFILQIIRRNNAARLAEETVGEGGEG